jgi:hypothetical protein
MKFTTKHSRAFTGNDISVTVTADKKDSITLVAVKLDDSTLDERALGEGTESYNGDFPNVGDAAPDKAHVLVVTVWDQDRKAHSSTSHWIDQT